MKRLIIIVAVAAMMILSGSLAFAYDITTAKSDMQDFAVTLNNNIVTNMGGMSFIGEPVGYSFTPRFEFGAAIGAVLVPLEDIIGVTSFDLDIGDFDRIPIPAGAAHGKFSIGRIEIGGKIAGIPEWDIKKMGIEVSNIVIGGKVRYRLLNFKTFGLKGGASVGGFYEYMKGYLYLTQSKSIPIDVDDDEKPEGTLTNEAGFETNWNAHTFGGEAQANLQLLLFNLFAGTRLSKSFGKAETTVAGTSTLTGGGVSPGSTTLSISEESKPEGIDMFLFGGAEVNIFMLTVTGRVGYNLNNKNYTIDGGLSMQF